MALSKLERQAFIRGYLDGARRSASQLPGELTWEALKILVRDARSFAEARQHTLKRLTIQPVRKDARRRPTVALGVTGGLYWRARAGDQQAFQSLGVIGVHLTRCAERESRRRLIRRGWNRLDVVRR